MGGLYRRSNFRSSARSYKMVAIRLLDSHQDGGLMRVLVTGGAGYIGSVITDQLLEEGHKVVVFDNLSKGHRDAVSDAASFVQADLLDDGALRQALGEHQIEAVVHMAASSLVGESMT